MGRSFITTHMRMLWSAHCELLHFYIRPSRGTELCTVVEAMFSYETMFSVWIEPVFSIFRMPYNVIYDFPTHLLFCQVHGDTAFADRVLLCWYCCIWSSILWLSFMLLQVERISFNAMPATWVRLNIKQRTLKHQQPCDPSYNWFAFNYLDLI